MRWTGDGVTRSVKALVDTIFPMFARSSSGVGSVLVCSLCPPYVPVLVPIPSSTSPRHPPGIFSINSAQGQHITQPQERNTNGKMFGGSLMRGAYELARTVAYVFGGPGSRPFLVASDRIAFLSPVEVGSVLEFTGSVVYCEGHPHTLFQVQVETTIRETAPGRRRGRWSATPHAQGQRRVRTE